MSKPDNFLDHTFQYVNDEDDLEDIETVVAGGAYDAVGNLLNVGDKLIRIKIESGGGELVGKSDIAEVRKIEKIGYTSGLSIQARPIDGGSYRHEWLCFAEVLKI